MQQFQSTRSSQTSTGHVWHLLPSYLISIHEVFADLDRLASSFIISARRFQSTRSSQTSTRNNHKGQRARTISIHEVFADLDLTSSGADCRILYFNPRGLRRPRPGKSDPVPHIFDFNPRGLRRPRHRDRSPLTTSTNFNPRGLRRPRQFTGAKKMQFTLFQSTRSSQTSTLVQ